MKMINLTMLMASVPQVRTYALSDIASSFAWSSFALIATDSACSYTFRSANSLRRRAAACSASFRSSSCSSSCGCDVQSKRASCVRPVRVVGAPRNCSAWWLINFHIRIPDHLFAVPCKLFLAFLFPTSALVLCLLLQERLVLRPFLLSLQRFPFFSRLGLLQLVLCQQVPLDGCPILLTDPRRLLGENLQTIHKRAVRRGAGVLPLVLLHASCEILILQPVQCRRLGLCHPRYAVCTALGQAQLGHALRLSGVACCGSTLFGEDTGGVLSRPDDAGARGSPR